MGTDLRLALRAIARMPILAAVVVASLGVGIGVNTVVFSWIQGLVVRSLPGVDDASAVHLIEPRAETGTYPGASWREFRDLQTGLASFDSLFAARMVPLNVGEPGRPERKYGLLVSGNYFSGLGLTPLRGRLLADDDTAQPGGAPVIVISHAFWQSHLRGSESAIGHILRVNDRPVTVVGIAPEGFIGTMSGLVFDLWAPATMAPVLLSGSRELDARGIRGYSVMGRLRGGATISRAQAELDRVMESLGRDYPDSNATIVGEVLPFWKAPRGPRQFLIGALAVLQALMIVLLLAICGNTANLMLARAAARTREVGVRVALGANRWRIVRLLMIESVLLGAAGAVLGVLIALWGTEALRADIMPLTRTLPLRFDTSVDTLGLILAGALGIGCGALFGTAPALQLARIQFTTLRTGTASQIRTPLRRVVMAGQAALAIVVVIAAGTFLRSFATTQQRYPGFEREGVLLAAYDLRGRNGSGPAAAAFVDRLLERVRALPAVEDAAIASSVPLDIHGLPLRLFTVDGRARPDGELDSALTNTVTAGYFDVMRIARVAGTDFAPIADTQRAPEAIVNEEFVRRFLAGVEPLGRRIENGGRAFTISGVVRNSLYESFDEPPTPIIYFSYRDRMPTQGELHVRTRAGQELTVANDIRRVVREIDAELPIFNVRTMTEHVDANLFIERIPARMFAVLGPLIVLMAAIGIYAVVAYTAAQRTVEIGVRLALGATRPAVIRAVLASHVGIIAAGAIVGWLGAFVLAPRLDAVSFVVGPALLLTVAFAACFVPARRASRVDPLVALRQE
jgi:predicted permease